MDKNQNKALDTLIIRLLQDQDQKGVAILYEQYAPVLFGVIQRILQNQEASEEVLQDTFLKIWSHIGSFNADKGNLLSWIIRIARNAAIDRKRLKKINSQSESLDNFVNSAMDVGMNTDTIGVKDLTFQLDPNQRQIIDLIYFEGYTHAETAEQLELPLGTVKTRLRNAIQQMKEMFRV